MLRCALAIAGCSITGCSSEDNLGSHAFGDVRWSVAVGGPGDERPTALAIDTIGNVIVAGTCNGVVEFGTTRADCRGSFITRRAYDTGREEWTLLLHNTSVSSLSIDELGYIHAAGSYSGTADIAGMQLTATGTDPFLVVLDGNGAVHGLAGLGVSGIALSPVGVVEPDGCFYVTGGFHGTMQTPDGVVANHTGELDAYVSGHFADTSGAWTVQLGGEGEQLGRALALRGERLAVLVHSTAAVSIGDQQLEAPAWPASMLMQFAINGELLWAHAMPAPSEHLATTRTGAILVTMRDSDAAHIACSRIRAFDIAGRELWASECEDAQRTIDAIAVGAQGRVVTGGRNLGEGGEIFLAAHDDTGRAIGNLQSPPSAFVRDSSFDGVAIEPSGEVVFIAGVTHPFDFGSGALPFAGGRDAVIVKLDSPTGHDGPVVLTRE